MNNKTDILLNSLDRILAVQRFAEAKNGALLALIVAIIIGLIQSTRFDEFSGFASWLLMAALTGGVVAVVMVILSFLPRHRTKLAGSTQNIEKNSFYFGDAAKMSENEILDQLVIDEGSTDDSISLLIAEQIRQNSTICNSKMQYFRYASYLSLISFVLLGGAYSLSQSQNKPLATTALKNDHLSTKSDM